MADPATFLASKSTLGSLFSSENCLFGVRSAPLNNEDYSRHKKWGRLPGLNVLFSKEVTWKSSRQICPWVKLCGSLSAGGSRGMKGEKSVFYSKTQGQYWPSEIMLSSCICFAQFGPIQPPQPSGSAAVSARLVPLVLYLVPPRGRLWLVVNKCCRDVCVLFSPVDSASATAALNERAGLGVILRAGPRLNLGKSARWNGWHYCVIDM